MMIASMFAVTAIAGSLIYGALAIPGLMPGAQQPGQEQANSPPPSSEGMVAFGGIDDARKAAGGKSKDDGKAKSAHKAPSAPSKDGRSKGGAGAAPAANRPTTPQASPVPPSPPPPAKATNQTGPFESYAPGAAFAGPGAAAAAGTTTLIDAPPPAPDAAATPLLRELLARPDYSGSPSADWELVWRKGGYPGLKVIPHFDPNDVSAATPDGIRKVDVTFLAEYDGSKRGPFRKTAKSTWTFNYLNNGKAEDPALTMRVYFVGKKFGNLRLLPFRARGASKTSGTTEGAIEGRDLRDVQLDFYYRNSRNEMAVLTGTSQRLILDPEGKAYFAFVICDSTCPPPPDIKEVTPREPDPPDTVRYAFEIVFYDAASDKITDRETVAKLIGTEPFISCLRDAGVEVKIEQDRTNDEHYASASIFRPECDSAADNVDYDPVRQLAEVSVGKIPTTPTSEPKPAPTPGRTIRFLAGDEEVPDLKGELTLSVGDEALSTLQIVGSTVTIPQEVLSKATEDKPLSYSATFERFEDLAKTPLAEGTDPIKVTLTPVVTLADLRILPVFKLLGEDGVPAEGLVLSKDCAYRLRVGEDEPVELTPTQTEAGRTLAPKSKAKRKLAVSDQLTLLATPVGTERPCLSAQPFTIKGSERVGRHHLLKVEIEHPNPGLLILASSAQFPLEGDKVAQQDALDAFWYPLLQGLYSAVAPSVDAKRYDWLFAHMAEGSVAGNGTTFLAGTETAAKLTAVIDLKGTMTAKTYETLILTPEEGTSLPKAEQLKGMVRRFAKGGYTPVEGFYHTAVWIHGDPSFTGDECQTFAEIAKALAAQRVRLLEVVAAGKINRTLWPASAKADSAGDAAQAATDGGEATKQAAPADPVARPPEALVPFSDKVKHRGILQCNPEEIDKIAPGSRLLVFQYDQDVYDGRTRGKLSAALQDALAELRRLPEPPKE